MWTCPVLPIREAYVSARVSVIQCILLVLQLVPIKVEKP